MPLTPAQVNINAEVASWCATNPQLAQSNYVIKKLESHYTRNYDVKQSGTNGALTAIKELLQIPYTTTPTNVQMRAYLKETQVVPPQVNATLNNANNLGLISGQGTNTKFEKLGINNYIEVTQFGPGALPACVPGDYIRVKHRPNTLGVITTQNLASGVDGTVQAQVQENTVVPLHTGGTLALAAGVEWPVVVGTAAHVTYNALTSSAVLFNVPAAMFAGLVNIGDYLELTVRLAAPATLDPTLVGYYKVTGVGTSSLLLDRKRYTRTSEGVFVQDPTNLPNMADDLDWRVFRTAQNVLYLRHAAQSFNTVVAGDFVRATSTPGGVPYNFTALSSPAVGLILLNPLQHMGASAPYTATTNITVPFSVVCSYAVTRAPAGVLSLFKLTATTDFLLAGAQVGYFVHLTNGTGPFGPTIYPANLGYFRINGVAQHVLTLDNQPYTPSLTTGAMETLGSPLYVTYTDDVDYTLLKSVTVYPNSRDPAPAGTLVFQQLFYEVIAVTPGYIRLDTTRWEGYNDTTREISLGGLGPVSTFTDYFDIDVIHPYGPRLYLRSASGAFPVLAGLNAGQTFAVTTAHLAGVAPYTHAARVPVVTGAFKVLTQPVPDILFVARDHYAGRALEGPGTQFAPYELSANQSIPVGSWAEPVDMRVTVQDLTVYDRVVVTGAVNAFTDVATLDFLQPRSLAITAADGSKHTAILNALIDGHYFEVTTKTNNQSFTVGNLRRGYTIFDPASTVDLIFLPILDSSQHFDPLLLSSFAADIGLFNFKRAAAATTRINLEGVVPAAGVAVNDFVVVTYSEIPLPLTATFQITAVNPTSLTLAPVLVTGTGGVYTVTATPLALDMRLRTVTAFEVQRPTGALAQVADYLTAFTTSLLPALKTALDQGLDQLYNATFDVGGVNYTSANKGALLDVATAAIQQVVIYLPAEIFARRGFAEGTLVAGPSVANTPTDLADLDISQAPYAAQNTNYQDMVAVTLSAYYNGVFQRMPLQRLKDIYTDMRLQELGYLAETTNVPLTDHRAHYSIANSLRNVLQVKNGVVTALATLLRTDIKTLVDTQLANLLPIILGTISNDYAANKNAYFVRSGTSIDPVLLNSALAGFPGSFITSLLSSFAAERRRAFQVFIAVPTDPSLRVKRRSYARLRNAQRSRTANLTDVTNHLAQTTDPLLVPIYTNVAASLGGEIAAAAPVLALMGDELARIDESAPGFIGPPNPSRLDMLSGQKAVDNEVGGADGASAGNLAPVPQTLPVTAAAAEVVSPVTTVVNATELTSPVAGIVVTNLFDNDIHDFRVTAAVIPYHVLNSTHNNGSNFATISLCEFNLTGVGDTPINLANYGALTPKDGKYLYNQFKLVSLAESYAEKFQIVDTLSDSFMTFSFGRRPEVWSLAGTLINDIGSDQLGKFRTLYEDYIRLSALEKRKKKMVLTVPALGIQVCGYAVAFVPQNNADGVASVVPFNLQFVVTNVTHLPQIKKLEQAGFVPISGLVKYLHTQSGLTTGGGKARTASAQDPLGNLGSKALEIVNKLNPNVFMQDMLFGATAENAL